MPQYRIYSETLAYDEVSRPTTIALLRRYGLDLVLAVRPWQLGELPEAVKVLSGAGVAVSVWPMLADEDGRWASVYNAAHFARFVRETCDTLEAAVVHPRDVLLDLEPRFSRARPSGAFGAERGVERKAFASAVQTFATTVDDLRARGVTTSLAVWPLVALDPPGSHGWQTLLGTPVDALGAEHVSVMMYTSILEGWSRGVLRRHDALELLARAGARVVARYGERGGISLGCVGTGAFEDEPVYRAPAELASDAIVARAAGARSIALFDLGGVLARPPAEAWLDALVDESLACETIPASGRVAAARSLARAATWVLRRHRR